MTTITKKALYALVISSLMMSLTTVSMQENYPQQLQIQPKDVAIVTLYGMITNDKYARALNDPIKYATQSVHTKLNLPSTIYDPIVTFKIVDDLSETKFKKVIPLKHCFNLNDGSVLTTVEKNGSQLYPNDPVLKNKWLLIKILCKKNPKIKGDTFAQQRHIAKEKFYKEPGRWAEPESEIQQLTEAGILKKIRTEVIITHMDNDREEKEFDVFGHGPHGCFNDEKLKQSMLDEKIPKKKNIFTSIMERQLTGLFKK